MSERVATVDPPVFEPVEEESQEASRAEDRHQGENTLAIVPPVAPDLYTSPLPSRIFTHQDQDHDIT